MMYVCVCVCINVVRINNIFDAHGRYIFSLRLRERGKIMVLADDISVCDTKQQQCLDGPRSPRCNFGQFFILPLPRSKIRKFEKKFHGQ